MLNAFFLCIIWISALEKRSNFSFFSQDSMFFIICGASCVFWHVFQVWYVLSVILILDILKCWCLCVSAVLVLFSFLVFSCEFLTVFWLCFLVISRCVIVLASFPNGVLSHCPSGETPLCSGAKNRKRIIESINVDLSQHVFHIHISSHFGA